MNRTEISKHTRGPWEWHHHEDDKDERGPGYLFAPAAPYSSAPGHLGKAVVHAIYPSIADKYVHISCDPADARLIAAAPDLLKVLQAIAKQCPPSLSRAMYSTLALHDDERDAMYAAIAKATEGRQ